MLRTTKNGATRRPLNPAPPKNGRTAVCSAQSPSLLLSSLPGNASCLIALAWWHCCLKRPFSQFAPVCPLLLVVLPLSYSGRWQPGKSDEVESGGQQKPRGQAHCTLITTGRQRYSLRVADHGRQAGVPWQKGPSPLHAHRIFVLRGKAVAIAHRSRSFITTTMAPVVLGRSIHEAAWLDCVDRG